MTEDFDESLHLQRVSDVLKAVAASHSISSCFESNESLVDGGMSSMEMIELMLSVESEFRLRIPDPELIPRNFSNLSSLAKLLMRLLKNQSNSKPRVQSKLKPNHESSSGNLEDTSAGAQQDEF